MLNFIKTKRILVLLIGSLLIISLVLYMSRKEDGRIQTLLHETKEYVVGFLGAISTVTAIAIAVPVMSVYNKVTGKNRSDYDDTSINNLLAAVYSGNINTTKRLIAEGADLENPKTEDGSGPLLSAVGQGKYAIAQILVDAGADIWTHNIFGVTIAHSFRSDVIFSSPDTEAAYKQFFDTLKSKGMDFPGPDREMVLRMVKEGNWPPSKI